MKKYNYLLTEWNKGEIQSSGSTKNPARTVISTWRRWHADFDLRINNYRLLRVDGISGFYDSKSDRISKELMIELLLKWSSF
tara:strand:+ start:215 stop:460 length:246 start_codon:yes stop_codon:yes gene_type:complete